MPTINYKLGRECTLTIATNELKLARDVTITQTSSEADVTTRNSNGIKQTAVAMRELSIEGSALYDPDDPAITTLQTSYNTNAPFALTISDPTLSYSGKWICTEFKLNQPLEEAATVDFTLKPTLAATET